MASRPNPQRDTNLSLDGIWITFYFWQEITELWNYRSYTVYMGMCARLDQVIHRSNKALMTREGNKFTDTEDCINVNHNLQGAACRELLQWKQDIQKKKNHELIVTVDMLSNHGKLSKVQGLDSNGRWVKKHVRHQENEISKTLSEAEITEVLI